MQVMRARTRLRVQATDWRRLAAILLALIALGIGVLSWLGYQAMAQTMPVQVAAQDVLPGTRLTADHVRTIPVSVVADPALRGVADAQTLIGQYTTVFLSADQVLHPHMVQADPLDVTVYDNTPLPPEPRTAHVFELPLTGMQSVTAQDTIHILVVITGEVAQDPTFTVGAMDTGGSGPRVVRVLGDLNVLHVDRDADMAYLAVTPNQNQYLWSVMALPDGVQLIGEPALADLDAPLGPLQAGEASLALLSMDQHDVVSPTTTPEPATPVPEAGTGAMP